MKLIPVLLSCVFAFHAGAQDFEYFEDLGYRNEYTSILNVGDSMWVVTGNFRDQYYTTPYVAAIDTNGVEKWRFTAPNNSEVQEYSDLLQLPGGNFAVFGGEQYCCDCTIPYARLSILSPEGELVNDFSYPDFAPGKPYMALTGGTILLNGTHQFMPTLFAVDTSGQFLWGVESGAELLSDITSWSDGFIAFYEEFAVYIDTAGVVSDTLHYDAPPQDVSSSAEHMWMLFEDGIYTLTDSFQLEMSMSTSHANRAERLLMLDDGFYLWNDSSLIRYNEECQLTDSVSFVPIDHFETGDVAVSSNQCAIAGARYFEEAPPDFQIYRGATIKSISLTGQSEPVFPDVSLGHFELAEIELVVVDEASGLFGITGVMSGYLINSGDVVLDAVNITEFHSQGICGLDVTRESMEDLNLLPGDSIYITQTVGPLNYGDIEEVLFGKVCLFVSGPNHMHDRDETNDFSCAAFDIVLDVPESAAISAVYPNPASDQVRFQFLNQQKSGQLQVMNAAGELMTTIPLQENQVLNVSTWSPGIYFARIISDGTVSDVMRFSVIR